MLNYFLEVIKMAPTISQISKELNIPSKDLTKRSLIAYLEHELRLAEEDIADIRDKYLVSTSIELEKKVKNKKISSHPAWEDLIAWENLEDHIAKLKHLIQALQ